MREMRRLNKCIDHKDEYGLTVRSAIKAENRRLEKKMIEKNLARCFKRMFGEVCPVKRNTGYPFEWH